MGAARSTRARAPPDTLFELVSSPSRSLLEAIRDARALVRLRWARDRERDVYPFNPSWRDLAAVGRALAEAERDLVRASGHRALTLRDPAYRAALARAGAAVDRLAEMPWPQGERDLVRFARDRVWADERPRPPSERDARRASGDLRR